GLGRHPQLRRVLLLLAAGVLIALVVDVALAYIRFGALPPPRGPRFRPPILGPWEGIRRLWFLDDLLTCMGVFAAGFAREYSLRLRLRQEEAVRLQAEAARLGSQLAESRLAALRTQLDPHFLFNTLHAVSALVTQDPRGVRRMISLLSELLRRSLEGAHAPEVSLREELDFVGRYLEIMQIRFQGQLQVATHAAAAALEGLVPNLILQPLGENAIKHGRGDAAERGAITITAAVEGDDLVLAVEDSGPGSNGPLVEGLGIRNTRERLAALYGPAQALHLGPAPGRGFRAEVHIPYHTAADLRASLTPPPEA
ncbi:MAG: histidine kinase, partial [Gemmatimonadetes bacterium]|nr:histidine kinase [Gemmatimonadota bacterium]